MTGRTESVRPGGRGWKWAFFAAIAALSAVAATSIWAERLGKQPFSTPPPPRRQRAAPPAPPPEGSVPEGVTGLERPEPEPVDPIAPAGDLAADIAAFTELRECAIRHRMQDPLVADLVDAIGYDTLVFDACRGIKALKTRDLAVCDATAASRMRDRCTSQVAMLLGQEDACPTETRIPEYPEHDATCIAVARRDVRPCASLDGMERATCEGLVARDVSRCGTDPRCTRLVTRWRSSLPASSGKSPYAASIRLEVTTLDADGGVAEEKHELAREAAAGAVVIHKHGETRIVVGDPRGIPAHGDVRGGIALVIPADQTPGTVRTPAPRVIVRWASGLVSEVTTGTQPKVTIDRLGSEPNSALKMTVEATLGPTTSPRKTLWTIDTWVRDVVNIAAPAR